MVKEATIKHNQDDCVNKHRRTHYSTALNSLICLLLGFLISGASFKGNNFVGGVAFVGASGAGVYGFFSLIGSICGYSVFFGVDHSMTYIAAALFTYTIAYIFQYLRLYRTPYFMPVIVMFLVALIRAFAVVNIVRNETDLLSSIIWEILFSGGLTFLYSFATRTDFSEHNHRFIIYSQATILSSILMTLCYIKTPYDISIANIIATAIYFLISYYIPYCKSYPIAFLFGFSLYCSSHKIDYAMAQYFIFSFSDLLDKPTKYQLLGYEIGASMLIAVIYSPNIVLQNLLIESALGGIIFCIFARKKQSSIKIEPNNAQKHHNTTKILALSDLMELISNSFSPLEDQTTDTTIPINGIFDRAAEQVCGKCDRKLICWNNQIFDMVSVLDQVAPSILERGKLLAEDLPDYFTYHCEQHQSFVLAVNHEVLRSYESRLLINQEKSNAMLMSFLLHLFSDVLHSVALETSNSIKRKRNNKEHLSAEIGIASKRKNGESVSGDSVRYFKNEEGMLYIILSDGIGTGDYAEQQSALVVNLLEKTLRSLNDPILALTIVNTVVQQQKKDLWGFATIDLTAVDLNTGSTSFYKLGAANSFVLTQEGVNIVYGNSYSVGFEECINNITCCQKMILQPDSMIIMASDGASIVDLSGLLSQISAMEGNMKLAAKKILLAQKDNDSDDQTVIVLSLMKR